MSLRVMERPPLKDNLQIRRETVSPSHPSFIKHFGQNVLLATLVQQASEYTTTTYLKAHFPA